jgi:hypothetical protein
MTRPPHGYSPQQLSELGTAELFVLSSLRLWFLAHCDHDHQYPDWRQAFETAGIGQRGTWGFDRLCRIVGTTTLRALDIHWLRCGRLGEFEACLLTTLGHLQHNRLADAENALLQWCPATAVRLALEAAHVLAGALQSHSLFIPLREQEGSGMQVSTVHVAAGSARLH